MITKRIKSEEETHHAAWAVWLGKTGHIPGTTMGQSGRDDWAAFRDGWDAAAQVAFLPLERAKMLEEANHGPTSHFHEYRLTLERLGVAS